MMRFITAHKQKAYTLLGVLFWLFVWQAASVAVGYKVLLPPPLAVLKAMLRLFSEKQYLLSMTASLLRIATGFFLALFCGILLSVLASRFKIIQILLSPFMLTIKSIPVASFTVLALLWLNNSKNLAVLICFFMVLPIIYTNTLAGISSRDQKLAQMAKVFRIPLMRRIIYIDIMQIFPHLLSACTVSLGLCWKSGVAAEVIGITKNSIGGQIYDAKLLFSTEAVLAWTVVIIVMSFLFEKLVLALLRLAAKRIKQGDVLL